MNKLLILFSYGLFNFVNCSAQDTVLFQNKFEFERQILYSFLMKAENLNKPIKKKINRSFKKFDFSDSVYHCQYPFSFHVKLDTLGRVMCCENIELYSDRKLHEFSNEIECILENSNFKIQNKVTINDSSYFFKDFIFAFNTGCYPPKVNFEEYPLTKGKKDVVFTYAENSKSFYFYGFE